MYHHFICWQFHFRVLIYIVYIRHVFLHSTIFLENFFKSVTEFQSVSIISCTPIFLISHVIDFKKSFKLLWGQQKNEKISEFEYDTLYDNFIFIKYRARK